MNDNSDQSLPPRLLDAIFRAIDEANQQQDAGKKIAKSADTVLLGDNGVLDSVGLINFLILLEQQVEQSLGATISLTADPEIYGMDSPLRKVRLLALHLQKILPPASFQ